MGFNIGPRVIRATGGSISREGNFRVHTFPSRRVSEGLTFEVDFGNPACTGRIKQNNQFESTVKDLSGNGNDLSLNGSSAPIYTSGEAGDKGGGQIVFARSSQQYADADNPSGVRAHADIPFTMEAWARRTNGDSYNTVMAIHGQYTEIGFDQSSFLFGRNGGGGNVLRTATGCSNNTWYHIVMTYDGNPSYDVEFLVDGVLKATGTMGFNSSRSNTTKLRLGSFATTSEMFTGHVAIARFYNRCLSRQEVSQNFDADKVRFRNYTNTFTPTCSGNGGKVEVLQVAGGGGGGRNHGGGGGGAGGLIHTPKYSVTNSGISITVGAGGTGGGNGTGATNVPLKGQDTVFGSLTAIGGGIGGSEDTTAGRNGTTGGSGGGGSGYASPTNGGAVQVAGQGNVGGAGATPNTGTQYGSGGGGGGAGSAGEDGGEGPNINGGGSAGGGGAGLAFDISGDQKFYAGGGGGGFWEGNGGAGVQAGGLGGSGVGGNGGNGNNTIAYMGTNAKNYTGSGGGGSPGSGTSRRAGNGGAGTVLVRYPAEDYNIEVLVVAGGGGGGANADIAGGSGGGGGAGGLVYHESFEVKSGKNYIVEVGRGGAGGSGANVPDTRGINGHRSTFGELLALGGGGGGSGYDGTVASGRNDGMVGGSGGGGGANGGTPASGYGLGGKGTSGQGFDGGGGSDAGGGDGAGGGGGAGAVGEDGVGGGATAQGGAGGAGLSYSITGSAVTYAGGGGGGGATNDSDSGGGDGGAGGGAAGGHNDSIGNNATANTGGGGGGAGVRTNTNRAGGSGGSGIVIVAYKGPQRGEGGSVSTTSRPGYTVHTFATLSKYLYIA